MTMQHVRPPDGHDDDDSLTGDLMTQTRARQQAAVLRAGGIPAIAVAVPPGSWGGAEKGWDVRILAVV
jgi:hypothetical protein